MKKKNNNSIITIEESHNTETALSRIMEVDSDYDSYLEKLPDKKKQRLINSVNATKFGLHTVAPLMCAGPQKCPFIDKCPIPDRASDGELI